MSLLDNAVLKVEVCGNEQPSSQSLHVAFGIDAFFAFPMGVSMTSFIANHQQQHITFHIFTDSLHPDDVLKLKKLSEQYDILINIYYIDVSIFKNLKTSLDWPAAIYYRFIMGKKLYGKASRVLYIDADTVCLNSITDLFDCNLDDKIIAAVMDPINIREKNRLSFASYRKKINLQGNAYFNSGVMLIDIDKWHENNISDRALALLDEKSSLYDFPDQDALNVLLENKVLFLDKKYNYLYAKEQSTKHILAENLAIIHYAARPKPWYIWYDYPLGTCYQKYVKESLWAEVPPVAPRTYQEMKLMAKAMKRAGKTGEMLHWYGHYCITKVRRHYLNFAISK